MRYALLTAMLFLSAGAAAQDSLPAQPQAQQPSQEQAPTAAREEQPQAVLRPCDDTRAGNAKKSTFAKHLGRSAVRRGGAIAGGAAAGPVGAAVGGAVAEHVGTAVKKVVGHGKKQRHGKRQVCAATAEPPSASQP